MDITYSLSRPHEVFLSKDIFNALDVDSGEPVTFEATYNDESIPIAAPVNKISNIDRETELYGYFSTLPILSEEPPKRVKDKFRDSLFDDTQKVDISGYRDLSEYIFDLKHQNLHHLENNDMIIGVGILDIISQTERQDFLDTPFASVPEELIIECLGGLEMEVDFDIEEFEVVEPETVLFCTHDQELPDEKISEFKENLLDIGYFINGVNYIISGEPFGLHGPILKESLSEVDPKVYKLNNENIRFNSSSRIPVKVSDHVENKFDEIRSIFDDELDDFTTKNYPERSYFSVGNESYHFLVIPTDDTLQIEIFHAYEEEIDDLIDILEELTGVIAEELGAELEVKEAHTHKSEDPLLNDVWVMDTNTIYKQYEGSKSTDINEYLFDDATMFDKNILIPWQVIGEINRHKEESSSLKNLSQKGIENLKCLKKLDGFGYINLQVSELPENFDNSVHPGTGMSDLGILSSIPENGVLITNDDRLMELARIFDIPCSDIVKSSPIASESDLWNHIEGELEDGSLLKDGILDEIAIFISSDIAGNHQDRFQEPSEYLTRWIGDDRLIRVYSEDGVKISISQNYEVTPTYRMVTRVSENIEEGDSCKLLTKSFLEELRSSIGRLPQTHLPKVEFVIPEQYVYRAKEVDQVTELMKIFNLANAKYRSESVNVDRSTVQTELNEAAIKTSQSTGSIMLCDRNEEELTMLSSLIDVEAVTL